MQSITGHLTLRIRNDWIKLVACQLSLPISAIIWFSKPPFVVKRRLCRVVFVMSTCSVFFCWIPDLGNRIWWPANSAYIHFSNKLIYQTSFCHQKKAVLYRAIFIMSTCMQCFPLQVPNCDRSALEHTRLSAGTHSKYDVVVCVVFAESPIQVH